MSDFTLHLQDATQYEQVQGVAHFVGRDATGQFGVQARHERLMTALVFGLGRFRRGDGPWEYLALPGGLLYFVENALYVCTSHYLRGSDRAQLAQALDAQLRREEEALRSLKETLHHLEQELMRRILRMTRG